jgi:RecJ-like exonuclease
MKKMVTCDKCNGRGYIPAYMHRHNGVCYSCNGSGNVEISESEFNKRKQESDNRIKTIEEIEAKIDAILDRISKGDKSAETQIELRKWQQELVKII